MRRWCRAIRARDLIASATPAPAAKTIKTPKLPEGASAPRSQNPPNPPNPPNPQNSQNSQNSQNPPAAAARLQSGMNSPTSAASALFAWVVCSFVRRLAADQHSLRKVVLPRMSRDADA